MGWVHASSYIAMMEHRLSGRDLGEQLISKPMGIPVATDSPEFAVAVGISVGSPQPTLTWPRNIDFVPETVRCAHSHMVILREREGPRW
jgi:hypothetical protein